MRFVQNTEHFLFAKNQKIQILFTKKHIENKNDKIFCIKEKVIETHKEKLRSFDKSNCKSV